jgi:hypothetical protein
LAAALIGAVAALVVVLPATPAQAASMTCTHAPAPSVSASGGQVLGHFYFSCNTMAGVTDIIANTHFTRQDGFEPLDGFADARDFHQPTAAWTSQFTVGSRHGTWTAVEEIQIVGKFVFQAPGCWRSAPTVVDCSWRSVGVFG